MSLEAIEFIKVAEEKARRIEMEGDKNIKEINYNRQYIIKETKEQFERELEEYELIEKQKFNKQLLMEKAAVEKSTTLELEEIHRFAKMREKQVVDDIVREVIKGYGDC